MLVRLDSLIDQTYPSLNAASEADLVFWVDNDLYRFAFNGGAKLGRKCGVFVDRATFQMPADTNALTLGFDGYVLPIHVSADERALREITVPEMDAKTPKWRVEAGNKIDYYYMGADQTVRFYPKYAPTWSAAVVFQRTLPVQVSHVAAYGSAIYGTDLYGLAKVPDVLQDFFRLEMIAGARAHESDGAMPETAAWIYSVTDLIIRVATVYWGDSKGL